MRTLLLSILVICASSAVADDDLIAFKLGPVIAAEEFCGFSFDGPALRDYLTTLAVDDTASFLNTLNMSISAAPYDQEKMNNIEKLTHCTLVERSAKELGFLK